MNKETIVEALTLTLWYYPQEKILHHECKKYPGVDALESMLQRGLDVMRTRGASKWLSDDRLGGALPKSHHEWGQNVWARNAAAAGWRYWALLPPAGVLASANVHRLAEAYAALNITVKTFRDPKAAMEWLLSRGGDRTNLRL
jgi:hypothetical protein